MTTPHHHDLHETECLHFFLHPLFPVRSFLECLPLETALSLRATARQLRGLCEDASVGVRTVALPVPFTGDSRDVERRFREALPLLRKLKGLTRIEVCLQSCVAALLSSPELECPAVGPSFRHASVADAPSNHHSWWEQLRRSQKRGLCPPASWPRSPHRCRPSGKWWPRRRRRALAACGGMLSNWPRSSPTSPGAPSAPSSRASTTASRRQPRASCTSPPLSAKSGSTSTRAGTDGTRTSRR